MGSTVSGREYFRVRVHGGGKWVVMVTRRLRRKEKQKGKGEKRALAIG